MRPSLISILVISLLVGANLAQDRWESVDNVLRRAISNRVTPGVSALVGNSHVSFNYLLN